MKIAIKTDRGRVRAINEDRAAVERSLVGYTLAVLADGMGGHQAGDIASQTAIDVILQEMRAIEQEYSTEQLMHKIQEAVEKANTTVFELATEQEQYMGMGTTLVAVMASRNALLVAHVGDSRAYHITKGSMVQLTQDHSLVNELVRTGQITEAEAEHHPRRNVLTRALGTEREIALEFGQYSWAEEDIVMLCSDGLSNLIGTDAMERLLLSNIELTNKAERLVEMALEAGGDDNVTVVLLANEADAVGMEEVRA